VEAWYHAFIVYRHLSQCHHSWANNILHCLSAESSELSKSSLAISYVSRRHGCTADGMLTVQQSGGSNYAQVLNSGCFFQPQSQGVDLYADRLMRGNIRYVVPQHFSNNSFHSQSSDLHHCIT